MNKNRMKGCKYKKEAWPTDYKVKLKTSPHLLKIYYENLKVYYYIYMQPVKGLYECNVLSS